MFSTFSLHVRNKNISLLYANVDGLVIQRNSCSSKTFYIPFWTVFSSRPAKTKGNAERWKEGHILFSKWRNEHQKEKKKQPNAIIDAIVNLEQPKCTDVELFPK